METLWHIKKKLRSQLVKIIPVVRAREGFEIVLVQINGQTLVNPMPRHIQALISRKGDTMQSLFSI